MTPLHRPFTIVGNSPAATTAPLPNVIAVSSGKGGVGKTWLSVTLCHALARVGQRVLLFDGDLGLANVDIQLGIAPKHDLGSVIAGRDRKICFIPPSSLLATRPVRNRRTGASVRRRPRDAGGLAVATTVVPVAGDGVPC